MIEIMYMLKDEKSGIYGKPFLMPNKAVCLRAMARTIEVKDSDPGMFPADFVLYEVGSYDNQTGEIMVIDREIVTRLSDIGGQE